MEVFSFWAFCLILVSLFDLDFKIIKLHLETGIEDHNFYLSIIILL